MSLSVGELVGYLKLDKSQWDRGLTGAETDVKKTSGKMLGGLAAVGGALAAAGVGTFFSGAIQGASDLNETVSKSKVIFGDQFAALDTWASKAATNLGLTKEQALNAASGFGDMFTQLGFGADQAADLSQSTVDLAADLGSFNNLPTEDVAQRIAAGFRGEYDSLQQLIPNINAARVEQVALATTGKKTTKELTAQDKAAAVLAIIHKDGAKAAGDFARTSDGLANKQKILTAKFGDLKTKIGSALLPVMSTLASVGTKVIDFITKNADVIGPLVIVLGTMAAVIGTVVAAQAAWAFVMGLTLSPIVLIVAGIAGLIAILILAYKKVGWFHDFVDASFKAIKTVVGAVMDFITVTVPAAFQALVDWVTGLPGRLAAAGAAIWTWITTKAGEIKDSVIAAVATWMEWIGNLPTTLATKAGALWQWITDKAKEIKDDVVTGLSNFWTWLTTLPSVLASKAGDVFGWLVDAAREAAADAWQALKDSFGPGGLGGGVLGGGGVLDGLGGRVGSGGRVGAPAGDGGRVIGGGAQMNVTYNLQGLHSEFEITSTNARNQALLARLGG